MSLSRTRETRRVVVVVLFLNLAVALAKLIYGYAGHVVALQADGLHSLLDAFANVVGLVGLHYAGEPADEGHPYGHKRVEHLAAAGVGVVILWGVVEVAQGIWHAYSEGALPDTNVGGLAVIVVTILVNIAVNRWETLKARELDSPFLAADAKHTLSDVFASLLVLAAYAAAHAGIRWADPVVGAIVVVFIGRAGYEVLRDNVPVLVDAVAIEPERVRAVVKSVPGVRGCHHLRSRGSRQAVHLDMHIQVDPNMTVLCGHELSHEVRDTLMRQFSELEEVLIHLEPDIESERYE